MLAHELIIFTVASAAYLSVPGASVVFLVNEAIAKGWKVVPLSVGGAVLSNIAYFLAALAGVGALAATSAWVFAAVQWIGVALLFWLAWSTWRSRPPRGEAEALTANPKSIHWSSFHKALMIGLLNPKKLIYLAIILPHVVSPDLLLRHQAVITLTFVALSLLIYGTYGVLAAILTTKLMNRRVVRVSQKVSATILFLIAVALGVSAIAKL